MSADDITPILEKRIGLFVAWGGGRYAKAKWPLGKLTLTRGVLKISAPFQEFVIDLNDIKYIKSGLLSISVVHQSANNPKDIDIHGLLLFRSIEQAVKNQGLNLQLKK
jgi:hypothetical protein